MLLVDAAEIRDEEGPLCINFPGSAEVQRVHDPVTEVDVGVTPVKWRQPRDRDFVIVVTLRVLESVDVVLRVGVEGRRE